LEKIKKIFWSVFRFFSSLKLAVIVLLSLAYVLALGTIYESLYGTAVAKEKVYGTVWFTLVLTFLGINVLCAALSRLPWKRHHIGFVVTHAGILMILSGSLITQRLGIDGSLALAEGEQEDRITLDDPLLQVAEPDMNLTQTWKARFSQDSSKTSKSWVRELKDGSRLVVEEFYPHAQGSLQVTSGGPAENPALQVVLSGLPMGPDQEIAQWLFLKDSEMGRSSVQMGPARISLVDEAVLKNLPGDFSQDAKTPQIGILRLHFDNGQSAEVNVSEALKKDVPVPGTENRLKVLRYLPDARVVEGRLVSRSEDPNNPALEFRLTGHGVDQVHVVFANFPDLEGVHGRSKEKLGVKAQFLAEQKPVSKAELFFALGKDRNLLYRVRSHGVLGEVQKTKIGEEVATGWMTIRFKVAEIISNALVTVEYRRVAVPSGKSGPPPALRLKIEKEGKSAETWIQQGDVKEMVLGGVPYLVRYGLRAHPLGFSLRLKNFEMGKYAGTSSPSSFESDVEVKNDRSGESFETKISMNHPLKYAGFTFYQSSYQEGEGGEPDISIFSVGRDPGTPLKFAGSIFLVGGIALMFWFKPLFVQKRITARKSEMQEAVGEPIS
jgi:ResB-like family protein